MQSLQDKLLKSARKKVSEGRIYSLSGIELPVYLNHRIDRLLDSRGVLVKSEMEYLLSETGPGNLRLSPELLVHLLKEDIYVDPTFGSLAEAKVLSEKKLEIERYVIKQRNDRQTQDLLLKILRLYISGAETVSTDPYIVSGTYENIPVVCLIMNGEWALPRPELFSFLRQCKRESRFPVIIARKVSGILFPVFKRLSILGLNLYRTYLPTEISALLDGARTAGTFFETKYCDQLVGIDQAYVERFPSMDPLKEPLKQFFEWTLKSHIRDAYPSFRDSVIRIEDTLPEILSQFERSKASGELLDAYEKQKKLLEELKLNFPPSG